MKPLEEGFPESTIRRRRRHVFLLYKLNVNRVVIRFMAAGHVYADPAWRSDERQREKLAVARARGSRFA
jgi:hypothetical protein